MRMLLLSLLLQPVFLWAQSVEVDDTPYAPLTRFRPGQTGVAFKSADEELRMAGRERKYHNGQSWAGPKDKAPVVLMPDQTFLMKDKHHHFVAGKKAKATFYPYEIVNDFSHMTMKEAYAEAHRLGMVYLEPEESIEDLMNATFDNLKDVPWRWLVNQVRAKVKVTRNELGEVTEIISVEVRSDYPVWVKVSQETEDFTEMALATFIRLQGISGKTRSLTRARIEELRALFLKAKSDGHPLMQKVPLIKKRTYYRDIDWIQILNDFICSRYLVS